MQIWVLLLEMQFPLLYRLPYQGYIWELLEPDFFTGLYVVDDIH